MPPPINKPYQPYRSTVKRIHMAKYTVIKDFRQISFRSYKKALDYCAENNVSQTNIFVDER